MEQIQSIIKQEEQPHPHVKQEKSPVVKQEMTSSVKQEMTSSSSSDIDHPAEANPQAKRIKVALMQDNVEDAKLRRKCASRC